MKNIYEKPAMEIIEINNDDILTAVSGQYEDPDNSSVEGPMTPLSSGGIWQSIFK